MSYHKFSNVGELFQGDLSRKIMNGVTSLDFKNLQCNCQAANKINNGLCIFNGECRHNCLVYKLSCKACDKHYIGCTQNKQKGRAQQHFNDVNNLVQRGISSTSFADHVATHFPSGMKVQPRQVHDLLKTEILWQGDPISCHKAFGMRDCTLCT